LTTNTSVQNLKKEIDELKKNSFSINIARGIPSKEQVDLSNDLLGSFLEDTPFQTDDPLDYRTYGGLLGIQEARDLFAEIFGISSKETIVGGNSSLQLMFITLNMLMHTGDQPWSKQNKEIKFLCPSPGYDRHFNMLNHLGIKMIPIELTGQGPDMDQVEELVKNDDSIKGIFCVPKYSNPSGEVYSDKTVERLAQLKTKAEDFVIMWDNAYAVHHLTDEKVEIANLLDLSIKAGYPERTYMYTSTSKITFPGGGVASIGTSEQNVDKLKNELSNQILSFDKVNQRKHVLFLKDKAHIEKHMEKHAAIMKPKFDLIIDKFEKEFAGDNQFVEWTSPKGGYFIHLETQDGCAAEIVQLMSDIGIKLTPANAAYPYGENSQDNSIRLAPSFAGLKELEQAVPVLIKIIKYVTLKNNKE